MSTLTAAVLLIGNELLSGRTQDTNLRELALMLGKKGIDLVETRVVKDKEDHIIKAVQELSQTYTYVFTTGGIGGTHDDITASCIAKAFNHPLETNTQALKILQDYYGEHLNAARARMALMPQGASLILNPSSAAPGFQIKNTFVLAGFPSILKVMLDDVKTKIDQGPPLQARSVTCELPEGTIADDLSHIQDIHKEVEIGSYPFFKDSKIGGKFSRSGLES